MSLSNHAFRHSDTLIASSPRRLRSGVMSFFVLLEVLSYSVAVSVFDLKELPTIYLDR